MIRRLEEETAIVWNSKDEERGVKHQFRDSNSPVPPPNVFFKDIYGRSVHLQSFARGFRTEAIVGYSCMFKLVVLL